MTSIRSRVASRLVQAIGVKRRLQDLAMLEGDEVEFARALRRLRLTDRRRPPWTVRWGWRTPQVDVGGFDFFLMTRKGEPAAQRVLLYLHGGGYMFGPFGTDWSAMRKIARAAGCDFAMLLYPRAPEHDARTALDVTQRAYTAMAIRYGARNVVPVGTSAGGGLALALMGILRDEGEVMPPCAVLLSPGVDLTLAHDVSHLESSDLLLTVAHVRSAGRVYAGDLGASHPTVSPLFGDLSGLPQLFVFVGTSELLRPSIEALARQAAAAGTEVQLVVGESEQHTWPLAPTPEGAQARRQIAAIVAPPDAAA